MAYETDTSVTDLVRGILDDARQLVREEVELAKAEARYELSKVGAAAAKFSVAAAAGWFAVMFVLVAAALGVSEAFSWPAWTGFIALGLLLAVIAGALALRARAQVRSVQPLPRTVGSLKENFR